MELSHEHRQIASQMAALPSERSAQRKVIAFPATTRATPPRFEASLGRAPFRAVMSASSFDALCEELDKHGDPMARLEVKPRGRA